MLDNNGRMYKMRIESALADAAITEVYFNWSAAAL